MSFSSPSRSFTAAGSLLARSPSSSSLSFFLPSFHSSLFYFAPSLPPNPGIYEKKILSKKALAPLAAAYVGYIVLNNLNLQLNTVGFYQITKIAVAPAVLLAEAVFLGKRSSRAVTASIGVVCAGVALATITDPQLVSAGGGAGGGGALAGLLVGAGAIAATTAYQIWAGTKQRELGAGSMQLLDQYAPLAAGMLGGLVLLREPLGTPGAVPPDPDTLSGYPYSAAAVAAIAVSAGLGLLVSLSTFLVIGATSSLTYNVVGHVKTVIILAGGCLFFGDEMPPKKLAGGLSFFFFERLLGASERSEAKKLSLVFPSSERAKRSEGAFSLSPSSETSEAIEAKRAKKLSICLTLSASSPFIIFNKQKTRQQGSPWRLPESSGTRS